MDSNIHVFTVWTHRSAKSIFGADSHPVIRNGELLCFPSEEHAQAECDRLNAASGGSHVHYSVKPAHIRPSLANGLQLLAEAFHRASERGIGGSGYQCRHIAEAAAEAEPRFLQPEERQSHSGRFRSTWSPAESGCPCFLNLGC